MSEYGNLEAGQDSDYFMVHMMAMTTENLRGKGDIAGELAYRDQRIAEQAAEITNLNAARKRVSDYNGRIEYQLAEQAAEIKRLKEAAIELLDALSEEQYSTTPPKAWPSIAPAANRLSDLVTRLEVDR